MEQEEVQKKKYKLLLEPAFRSQILGRTIYRIQALVDFSDVKAGDIGGYVESEKNLSHEGEAWIYDNAAVIEGGFVCDDAKVSDKAVVRGDGYVYENARVFGEADIAGSAEIYGNAKVYGKALVCGNSQVCGLAEVYEEARILSGYIFDLAKVHGKREVNNEAEVSRIELS